MGDESGVEKFDNRLTESLSGVSKGTEAEESADIVTFARERLGFDPDEKQELVLRGGRRGIVNCTRQWGKSTVTAAKAVHRAYSAPGSLTLVVTPSGRQSGEFLRKAEEFVRRLGIKVRGDGDNEISIAFPNGSRIVGLPGNEATVRGYSASLLLIDEAARVDDRLYRAMRPSLAVANGDLWLMSTPYGKRGFFWEEWEHGGPEWERISVPATECPRISAQLLAEECAKDDSTYRREYLCEFGDMEGAVFSRESIDAALQDFEPLSL
jgi:Terminase large subunit, T4likevirus-type, N-terminal